MQVSIYVESPDTKDKMELRTFEVSEEEFLRIKSIVDEFGHSADISSTNNSHKIILDGKHFEFSSENIGHYEEIKSKLLKGTSKEEATKEGISVDVVEDLASQTENHRKLIEISFTEITRPTTTDPIISEFLDNFARELEPFKNLTNPFASTSIEVLKTLPAKLEQFDKDAWQEAIEKVNHPLDFSQFMGSDEEKQKSLLQKKKELEALRAYVHSISQLMTSAKSKHLLIQQNSWRSKDLGTFDAKALNENYLDLLDSFTKCKGILTQQISQIHSELEQIEESKLENSIIVRTWYASASDDEEGRKLFGIPSDGHTTVELYKNKDERIYLGFYVCPNKDKSTLGQAFKKVGLPTPDAGKGYFVDLEYDRSLVGPGKKYSRCETVVVKCDRPGAELDFNAAYKWAKESKEKYPIVHAKGGEIRIIDDYYFYNNNCASFGAKALKKAGAGDVISYSGQTLVNIDTPTGVREYAQRLEARLLDESKKHIETEENRIIADLGKKPQQKYSEYIKFAIERLKLIHPDDLQLRPVLDSLISQLFKVAQEISRLPDDAVDAVNDYVDRLYIDLHSVINQFIENKANCDEVIYILKHLSSLMPIEDQTLIKAINSNIEASLKPYTSPSLMTHKNLGPFNDLLFEMSGKVITHDDDAISLFDKTLQIRTTLLQLNRLYQKAAEEFEKQKKDKPEQIEQISTQFKHLTDYYRTAQEQLRSALAELRNKIYLTPEMGKPNSRLQLLQELLLPSEFKIDQLKVSNLLQNAKSENTWARHNPALDRISENDQNAILMKEKYPDIKAPPKPHVWQFWLWPERHQHFELENKSKIYQVVNNNQLSWENKIHRINLLCDANKPGVLKIWRRPERQRYNSMKAEASLICLIQAFTEARLSEARLAVEIEKIIPDIEKSKRQNLINFKNDLIRTYQSKLTAHATESKSNIHSHATMLRKLLKATALDRFTHGQTLEDLGTACYSLSHYKDLKEKKENQTPPAVNEAKQQVEVETELWRRLSP